jgi:hypothetical protein
MLFRQLVHHESWLLWNIGQRPKPFGSAQSMGKARS